MTQKMGTDGMLQEWGTRLFYGMPKKGKRVSDKRFLPAGEVRQRVRAAVRLGAKQVVVKITGGGEGMRAVAAHFRYISRQGKPEVGGRGQTLELEDERGAKISGAGAIKELQYDWQMAGSYIPEVSRRREVVNIMLSMPAGTPPEHVLDAARDFARESFEGHKYVFVLHDDTDKPHVHMAVRRERMDGVRLNLRKADLRRLRELFAERLQDRGVNAVATHTWTRGTSRAPQQLWRVKAAEDGRLRKARPEQRDPVKFEEGRRSAIETWGELAKVLAASQEPKDRELARDVVRYVGANFGARTQREPTLGRGDIQQDR